MEKNKLMMIIIIVLLVILLGTIVGVSLYAVNTISASSEEETTVSLADNPIPRLTPAEVDVMVLEEPISANLKTGPDGEDHVAQVEVSIGVDNTKEESADFYAMLLTKEVIVKDVILEILRSKTYEEASRVDARDILKEETLQALREEFNTDLIATIYVPNYYTN